MLTIYTGHHLINQKTTHDLFISDLMDEDAVYDTTCAFLTEHNLSNNLSIRTNNPIVIQTAITILFEKEKQNLLRIIFIDKDFTETIMTLDEYGNLTNYTPNFQVMIKNLLFRRIKQSQRIRERNESTHD